MGYMRQHTVLSLSYRIMFTVCSFGVHIVFPVMQSEPRALYILCDYSTTELSQPSIGSSGLDFFPPTVYFFSLQI